MKINGQRLCDSLDALGQVGRYWDADAGLWGVNRLALTAADGEGRRHVVAQMRALGLTVTVDAIGNVYGRREGREPGLAPVMIGSHIDSVPTAGRFDGCLGVLAGLEVVATLVEAGLVTRRPLVVAFFTDEEGCRFGTDMLGSAVATGRLSLNEAYALRDPQGLLLRDELLAIGFLGEAEVRLAPPHAYLECHIEQGPVLAHAGVEIGVVTGVQGISWQELTLVGRSAHAGTTPMELRKDPGLVAARIHVHLREMVASGRYGQLRATMGRYDATPGLVNIVPSRVVCTVDLRNPDEALLRTAEADLAAFVAEVAAAEGVSVQKRQTARTPPVPFAPEVQARVAEAAGRLGLSHEPIVSGAGHDAQEMARLTRAGMVFVPGLYDGISHNPRELSTPEQLTNGGNVLLQVALAFAEEPA